MASSELHIQLKELVLSLERKVEALNDSILTCHNITQPQYHALNAIRRAKHISLIELSEIIGLDNSTISRTVNNLVNSGLVIRETDTNNRRYITIALTESGQKIFNDIESGMSSSYMKLLHGIHPEKRVAVLEALQTLLLSFTELEI